jgi:hypothetical protein
LNGSEIQQPFFHMAKLGERPFAHCFAIEAANVPLYYGLCAFQVLRLMASGMAPAADFCEKIWVRLGQIIVLNAEICLAAAFL